MSARTVAVTLRPPSTHDVDAARSIVDATGLFRPEEIAIAAEVFGDAVNRPGVDYHAIGAYDDDGALLGFACYGPTPATVHTWDLYWIVVSPDAQRQGIGARLIGACEEAVQHAGGRLVVIETSSRSDYGDTRGFYVGRGFKRAARIADYYAPDDDLIVYTKDLAQRTSHG